MKNVLDFNKIRNKFDLDTRPMEGGNLPLEVKMLKEEIQEFYDAEDLAERVDAMIDVRYVYEGTQMKYNYNFVPMDKDITTVVGEFHRISTTIVAKELGNDAQHFDKIMDAAWIIVCDINALKVSELDGDGKVIKQESLPNATDAIREMLESVITK